MARKSERGPGRPKGSERDDSAILNQMADLILRDPDLKPTTAMKRLGVRSDSDIRRHQVKWKARSPALLENAVERQNRTARHRSERAKGRQSVFANPLATSNTSRALASLENAFRIDPIHQALKLTSIGRIEELTRIENQNRTSIGQIFGGEFQKNLDSAFKNLELVKNFQ